MCSGRETHDVPQSSLSTGGDSVNQSITQYFSLSEEKLISVLELLRSHQAVSQAGVSLARLFRVPLGSDLKAASIGPLFSRPEPQVLEVEQMGCTTVHWADVLRSPIYDPKLQHNGKYRVRIDQGNALVELSKKDYEFINTKLPRQIIDPQSYPSDLTSEINTVKIAIAQIAPWQDIAAQCLFSSSSSHSLY